MGIEFRFDTKFVVTALIRAGEKFLVHANVMMLEAKEA